MIAVILPIYNQEKYLAQALDSLAAQTVLDFVAVCVDDGSTDATASILADYVRRNVLPMRVISKTNGGVSSARNAGLDAALQMSGVTHVTFLDPDDLIHPQAIEIMSRFAAEDPTQVVEWEVTSEVTAEAFLARRYDLGSIARRPFRLSPSVCTKLFPIASVTAVRFPENTSIAEDMAFGLEVCHRGRLSGFYLPVDLVYYRENPTSTMHCALGVKDFVERRAAVRHMTRIYAGNPSARDLFSRTALPSLLKRFYRDLSRVKPEARSEARRVFAACLAELRQAGNLHPRRASLKDLKYYFVFLALSFGGGKEVRE